MGLAHDSSKHKEQLAHDSSKHKEQLTHDRALQRAQLRHARVLQELDDRQRVLDEAVELLLLYRERAARGLRELSGTSPRLPYEDVDELPVLDRYTREDAVAFRRMEARLALRFGDDRQVVGRFREAQDEMKRAIRLIQQGAQLVSAQDAESARKAGRRAVKAFTQAARPELSEDLSDDPDEAPAPDITSRQG